MALGCDLEFNYGFNYGIKRLLSHLPLIRNTTLGAGGDQSRGKSLAH